MGNRKTEINAEYLASEGAVPVGGFLLTARLDNPASTSSKFPGLTVFSLVNKPLVLLVTLKNTTDHDLSYIIENRQPEYQIDVCGGVIRYDKKHEFQKDETLSQKPAFTAFGSRLYVAPNSYMARSTSYQERTIKSGESTVVRIFVDYLYDLTESGLYQISVRMLFPVHQRNEQEGTLWREYLDIFRYRQVKNDVAEEAVTNTINVIILRDVVDYSV